MLVMAATIVSLLLLLVAGGGVGGGPRGESVQLHLIVVGIV